MPNSSAILRRLPDLVFGSIVAAGAAFLLTEAADLPRRSALFPRAVLWCGLVVGLGVLFTATLQTLRGVPAADVPGRSWVEALVLPGFILVMAGAILYAFGFYIVSPLLIFAVYLWHTHASVGGALSSRSLAAGATLAIGATAAMYLIFTILIGLPAPSGALI